MSIRGSITESIVPVVPLDMTGKRHIVEENGVRGLVAVRAVVNHQARTMDISPWLHVPHACEDAQTFSGSLNGKGATPNLSGYTVYTANLGSATTINVGRRRVDGSGVWVPKPDFVVRAAGGLVGRLGVGVEFEASVSQGVGPQLVVPQAPVELCIDYPDRAVAVWASVPADQLVTAGVTAALSAYRLHQEGVIVEATNYNPPVLQPL